MKVLLSKYASHNRLLPPFELLWFLLDTFTTEYMIISRVNPFSARSRKRISREIINQYLTMNTTKFDY